MVHPGLRQQMLSKFPQRGMDGNWAAPTQDHLIDVGYSSRTPQEAAVVMAAKISRLEPGVAPGPDGLRPEFLQTMASISGLLKDDGVAINRNSSSRNDEAAEVMGLLAWMEDQFCRARLPDWFYTYGGALVHTPLVKKPPAPGATPDCRPIGAGHTLFKIFENASVAAIKSALEQSYQDKDGEPLQLCLEDAVADKGLQVLWAVIRGKENRLAMASGDIRNGYNEVKRSTVVQAYTESNLLQQAAPLMNKLLQGKHHLISNGEVLSLDPSGEPAYMEEGVPQGKPTSTHGFSIAAHPAIQAIIYSGRPGCDQASR